MVLLVCSMVYGVSEENRKTEILKCAMANGYEQRDSGSMLKPEPIWVRVTCVKCGGHEFIRNEPVPVVPVVPAEVKP